MKINPVKQEKVDLKFEKWYDQLNRLTEYRIAKIIAVNILARDKFDQYQKRSMGKLRSFYDRVIEYSDLLENKIYRKLKRWDPDSKQNEKLSLFARKSKVPISVFVFLYNKLKEAVQKSPLHKRGTHLIFGLPGSGKSSLAYDLAIENLLTRNKSAYISDPIEKPRYDQESGENYYLFKLFDIYKYFGAIEDEETGRSKIQQLNQFNTDQFNMVILDEFGNKFSTRMTMTKESKEVMVPLGTSSRQMRHQGLDYIYFLHQLEKIDITLMAGLTGAHEVNIDLDITYWQWVLSGKMTKHIMGWWLTSYKIKKKKGSIDIVPYKKWYRSVKDPERLKYFDTLSLRDFYKNLPKEKIKLVGGKYV